MLAANPCLPQITENERAFATQHVLRDLSDGIADNLAGRWFMDLVFFHRGKNRLVHNTNE